MVIGVAGPTKAIGAATAHIKPSHPSDAVESRRRVRCPSCNKLVYKGKSCIFCGVQV